MDQSSQLVSLTKMDIMSGDDSLTLPIMAVGGSGVVSVVANIAPAETKKLVAAALSGDYAEARKWHHRLLPVMKACFIETNPGPGEAALRMLGRIDSRMRLPMVEPKGRERRKGAPGGVEEIRTCRVKTKRKCSSMWTCPSSGRLP